MGDVLGAGQPALALAQRLDGPGLFTGDGALPDRLVHGPRKALHPVLQDPVRHAPLHEVDGHVGVEWAADDHEGDNGHGQAGGVEGLENVDAAGAEVGHHHVDRLVDRRRELHGVAGAGQAVDDPVGFRRLVGEHDHGQW